MLLAIDVGNTNCVFGLWDGSAWAGVWRRNTSPNETEDQLAVWLKGVFDLTGHAFRVDGAICASVVPQMNASITMLCWRWLGIMPQYLTGGVSVGLEVTYEPPSAVGADRLANALGVLELGAPPAVVVDFGTATTFDTIDAKGRYIGGAILPGVAISSQALASHTSKLPQIEFKTPDRAIGRNTVESLQSGVMLGYAGAIDELARRIKEELGGKARIVSTGGLGKAFIPLCHEIESYHPNLTLDGLVIAYERIRERSEAVAAASD